MKITDEMVEAGAEALCDKAHTALGRLQCPQKRWHRKLARAVLEAALAVAFEPERVDHSELIAEAEGRGCPYETCTCDGRLIRRLADALEGVDE